MNKFVDFLERCVKTIMLSLGFTVLFVLFVFSIFFLFGVKLDKSSIDNFSFFVLICMMLIFYQFLKKYDK
jgi:hypothetical protein